MIFSDIELSMGRASPGKDSRGIITYMCHNRAHTEDRYQYIHSGDLGFDIFASFSILYFYV